jgi:phosphatidylglycerol:prolipoprotein diacylglycerol transferase
VYPVLFDIQALGLRVTTYGLLLATAFLLSITLGTRLARREGLDEKQILDLGLAVMIAAIVGARLSYVVVHWGDYARHPGRIFHVWEGGLRVYGGIVAAVATAWWLIRKRKLDLWRYFDLCIVPLPLGAAIARVGCFLNGCCFGKPASRCPPGLPVAWLHERAASAQHYLVHPEVPWIHPSQLYYMAADWLLFAIAWLLYRRKRFDGQVFASVLLLYGVFRFATDFFRYEDHYYFGLFSAAQIAAFVLVPAAGYLLYRRRRIARTAGAR